MANNLPYMRELKNKTTLDVGMWAHMTSMRKMDLGEYVSQWHVD